ncbi:hypothetical protein ACFLQ0_04180 [Nitrospinota bacterium]
MKNCLAVFTGLSLLAFFAGTGMAQEKCITCHEGIEKISENNQVHNALPCATCHMGDPKATTMEAAHKGMFANPGDLRVVDKTCGLCHANEVKNAKKSLHATMAGQISGTRYAAGIQDRGAIYATADISDDDPKGKFALKSLKKIPRYDPSKPEGPTNHPIDDYLRNQCLRCHLWSDGHQRTGDYRASGCSACHVIYSDKGTYEGGDKAIKKDQKDRPRLHRITKKIPAYQCIHCHNRGGRTGVSFIGTMESDGYGTPWTKKGGKQGKLHGKFYNHLKKNVHFQKGMACIDCHTKAELHGDGNIYAKKWQAVEVECVNCHGTVQKRSNLKTSKGNPLKNLQEKGGKIVLTGKLDGKEHVVPQISELKYSAEGKTAMVSIPVHLEKLECYACHARWAPQCYGCHTKQDIGKSSGDWVNPKPGGDPSKASNKNNRQKTAFAWSESRSYLRWETPTLGLNSKGKVSPFIPGCQVVFTQMKGKENVVHNKIFKTKHGTSGFAQNPIQPHTTTKEARSCADCHMTTKALGLGSGHYVSKDNGLPIDFEMERIVDEEGRQIQATSHEGARPFNKVEQQRLKRSGACIACHGADPKVWAKAQGKAGMKTPTDELHQKAIRNILEK